MTHQNVFNFSAEEMKVFEGRPAEMIERGRSEYFSEVLPFASFVAKKYKVSDADILKRRAML